MKKTKLLFIVFMVIVLAGVFSVAMADQEKNKNQNQSPEICVDKCGNKTCEEVVCMGTGCPCAETKENCPKDCKLEKNNEGLGEEHRSMVADFVQKLQDIADNQKGGIGEQVRLIAQEQNQVREKIADEIESIQERNKIKTFLFGSNYKNLGALRSEMVQTRNRLEKLTGLMEDATTEADKAELQLQIQTMEQERLRIENFIEDNESKFSLFGWLVKLFNKKSE